MQRKYQVFISSTYSDLLEERQAAVEAVLWARHIPAGMELFSAGSESQLEVIKRWIDESDVYMLILGSRYGSIEPISGLSYTEIEYDHAVALNKPLFAVVLSDTAVAQKERAGFTEGIDSVSRLKRFRDKVLTRICRMVDDAKDIQVSDHSITH